MLICYEESQLGVWASDQDASRVPPWSGVSCPTGRRRPGRPRHTGEIVSLEKLEEVGRQKNVCLDCCTHNLTRTIKAADDEAMHEVTIIEQNHSDRGFFRDREALWGSMHGG